MGDDFGSWFDGGDIDLGYGSTPDPSTSWNASDPGLNSGYGSTTDYGGGDGLLSSSGTGTGSGTGFNWGSLIGPGITAVGGVLAGSAADAEKQKLLELQNQYTQQQMVLANQLQEQTYQAHGKQLADAYQGYKSYYKPQTGANNPTNIFGLLTPKPTSGPLVNGY